MNITTLKIFFIISIAICYSYNVSAQNSSKVKNEKSFVKYSNDALAIMEKRAKDLSIIGVAIVGFIPEEKTSSWVSKMKVVGVISNAKTNYLAIAFSKASEMAITLQNSGSDKSRKPLQGEFGYQGGLIKKINTGYIFTVFSGGSTENDLLVAQEGLNAL